MSASASVASLPHASRVGLPGLARLLVARLALAAMAFVLALSLSGEGQTSAQVLGLWAALALAFLSTAVSAAWMSRVRRLAAFGALQLLADVAMVTALVHFSGSGVSAFGFLYLPIPVFGAVLFDRPGAYGAALLASAAYALALVGTTGVRLDGAGFALWSAQTGALLVVGLLSSALTRELRVTGARLDASRARLFELRRLHERTVECLSSGLLTTDRARTITFFNPEAERITGRRAAEVIGKPLDEVLPGVAALADESGSGHGRMRSRVRVSGPGGEARHLGVAVSVLRGEDGGAAGYVTIFQDVTSVVQLEQELLRRERLAAVGELAASLAHEIRNPLAAISGSVELLSSGVPGPQDGTRLREIVLREIERLDDLIRDFLQYARPVPPKLEAVPVRPLLEEVLRMLGSAVPAEARLEVDGDPGAVALADPTQLRQVVWNLVRNAVDALEGAGVVRVEVSRLVRTPQEASADGRKPTAGGAVCVEIVVADTGRGIPAAELERIFDPFYTTKPDGTGLGLPTVYRIVEAHAGSLSVESQPGVGTRFRIRLPAAQAPA